MIDQQAAEVERRGWRSSLLALATIFGLAVAAMLWSAVVRARPPRDVEAKLVAIGRVVDAPGTAAIYGPMLAGQSHAGIGFERDLAYGPDARNILDVATPTAKGRAPRPVLIYVSGGPGNKKLDYPGSDAFYDNIMIVAVRHGMVGVNVERSATRSWDSSARDVAAAIAWVHQNIRRYGGDPGRIVIWGQSAGSNAVANYLSHQGLWGSDGSGVKAAIVMSGAYNLLPLKPQSVNSGGRGAGDRGAVAGAAAAANPNGGLPPPAPGDPATQLLHSMLPGFRTLSLPLYVTAAELDPEQVVEAGHMLHDAMCQAGHCPRFQLNAGESHISQVMSVNTADTSVSTPIFSWIKQVDR